MSFRNWTFTLHEPSIEEIENIKNISDDKCKYIIFGNELTQDGKLHLQGYIELNKCHRMIGVKKLLDPINGKKSTIHVEAATTGRDFNKRYCSKGLQSKEEYDSLADKGPNYGKDAVIYERTFKEFRKGQGKRNDWTDIYNKIKESPKFADILEEYPEYCIKYPNGIQKAIETVKNNKNLDNLKEQLNELKLFNWEITLENEIKNKPDNRKIIWYVDIQGGGGKTTFAKYLLAQGDCTYFTNGKSADIARAYNGERIAIFDFTRSIEGRVNYSAIEQIKNGLTFSSKYDSCHKINAIPHVICLSNFHPDESALSADRWDIRYLNEIDKQLPLTPMKEIDTMDVNTPSESTELSLEGSLYILDEYNDNILISSEDEDSLYDMMSYSYSCTSQSSEESESQAESSGNTEQDGRFKKSKYIQIPGALKSPYNQEDIIYEDMISKRQFDAELDEKYKNDMLDI